MLILNREDLVKTLSMEEMIEGVEGAFRIHHEGKSVIPLRVPLEVEEGVVLCMPSFLKGFRGSGALGVKVVSVYARNPGRGFPLIYATYLLNDPQIGKPLALMEGAYLTGMRTGAASAVAAKYLAQGDARALGIIGAGFQAFFQAWAISKVRNLKSVHLYDPAAGRVEKLAERLSSELKLDSKVMNSAKQLVRSSDILVTATTSPEPVFSGEYLEKGTTVIAIGAFTPETREVDDQTVAKSIIYVDSYAGVLAEAGDILIPMRAGILKREEIKGDLGEVVTGAVPGRETEEEIILFKSVGLAIEDAAAAKLAYEKAIDQGRGTEVEVF